MSQQYEEDPITQDDYQVGLLTLSNESETNEHQNEALELIRINPYCIKLLGIETNENSELFVEEVLEKLEKYHLKIQDKIQKEEKENLLQSIFTRTTFSGVYVNNDENVKFPNLIVKSKKVSSLIYITIDDFGDDRDEVLRNLMLSIPRQYLITLYHEISNKICSLISCMESSHIIEEMKRKEADCLKDILFALEYMKKIMKIFVLCHSISLDVVENDYNNKAKMSDVHEKIYIHKILKKYYQKSKIILDYRTINLQSNCFDKVDHLYLFHSNDFYIKKLFMILFMYIAYRVPENSKINVIIDHTKNGLTIGFVCGVAKTDLNNFIANSSCKTGFNCIKDKGKIEGNSVNNSVISLQIMEYLIKEICNILQFECRFSGNDKSTKDEHFLSLIMSGIKIDFVNNNDDDSSKEKDPYQKFREDITKLGKNNEGGKKMESSQVDSSYARCTYIDSSKVNCDESDYKESSKAGSNKHSMLKKEKIGGEFKTSKNKLKNVYSNPNLNRNNGFNSCSKISESHNNTYNNNNYDNSSYTPNSKFTEQDRIKMEQDKVKYPQNNPLHEHPLQEISVLSVTIKGKTNSSKKGLNFNALNNQNIKDKMSKRSTKFTSNNYFHNSKILKQENSMVSVKKTDSFFYFFESECSSYYSSKEKKQTVKKTIGKLLDQKIKYYGENIENPISSFDSEQDLIKKSMSPLINNARLLKSFKKYGNPIKYIKRKKKDQTNNNNLKVKDFKQKNNQLTHCDSKTDTVLFDSTIQNKIESFAEIPDLNQSLDFSCECKDVLVVDDEPNIRRAFTNLLAKMKLEADICGGGTECYEKIIKKTKCTCENKYYKLILLDIQMVPWNGIMTAYKIEELRQKGLLPDDFNLIFISGNRFSDFKIPQFPFIKAFYQKPITKSVLEEIVAKYYNKKEKKKPEELQEE